MLALNNFNILEIMWQIINNKKETIVALSILDLNTFHILVFIWNIINDTSRTHCCSFQVSTEYFNILVYLYMADYKNTKGNYCCPFQVGNEYFNILVFIWQIIKIRKEPIFLLSTLPLNNINIFEFMWKINNNTNRNHCCHFHVSTEYFKLLVFIWQIIKIRKEPIVFLSTLPLSKMNIFEFMRQIINNTKRNLCCHFHVSTK
jgi:hypothetical protein